MTQFKLLRRGFDLGNIHCDDNLPNDPSENWQQGKPVFRRGLCSELITKNQVHIEQSEQLVQNTLNGHSVDEFLHHPPYLERFESEFESLGSVFLEGNKQEIEMVSFDAINEGEIIAEDLWLKASWLSFYEADSSMRFRFSFGIDLEEDVALDPTRQALAAKLSDAIFPESEIITGNTQLLETIKEVTKLSKLNFVERIVYFNAPQGGAYLHHDLERGHAGVVYAQVSGKTCWLALPKKSLVKEVKAFIKERSTCIASKYQSELIELAKSDAQLNDASDSFQNDALINLINENRQFVQQLISHGHSRVLQAGDVILLPQADIDSCCWHSVFCLGEKMGQALSFAIR